jgi:hypothetical protein
MCEGDYPLLRHNPYLEPRLPRMAKFLVTRRFHDASLIDRFMCRTRALSAVACSGD